MRDFLKEEGSIKIEDVEPRSFKKRVPFKIEDVEPRSFKRSRRLKRELQTPEETNEDKRVISEMETTPPQRLRQKKTDFKLMSGIRHYVYKKLNAPSDDTPAPPRKRARRQPPGPTPPRKLERGSTSISRHTVPTLQTLEVGEHFWQMPKIQNERVMRCFGVVWFRKLYRPIKKLENTIARKSMVLVQDIRR